MTLSLQTHDAGFDQASGDGSMRNVFWIDRKTGERVGEVLLPSDAMCSNCIANGEDGGCHHPVNNPENSRHVFLEENVCPEWIDEDHKRHHMLSGKEMLSIRARIFAGTNLDYKSPRDFFATHYPV